MKKQVEIETNKTSLLYTDVDYERDGKQVGCIFVPHPRCQGRDDHFGLPIAVIKSGEGKTAFFMAGVHGDEFDGPVGLSNLIRKLQPDMINGRVIILPATNLPAVQNASRISPIDGRNLTRSFPGDPNGTITQKIAHYVVTELMARADLMHDFHAGGVLLEYEPYASAFATGGDEMTERCIAAMRAFGAPRSLVQHSYPQPFFSVNAALKLGVVAMGGEFGGCGALRGGGKKLVEEGCMRHLKHLGILRHDVAAKVPPPPPTRLVTTPDRSYFL